MQRDREEGRPDVILYTPDIHRSGNRKFLSRRGGKFYDETLTDRRCKHGRLARVLVSTHERS